MNRLDANASPVQIERLLAAARHNAERLRAIDDSDRAILPLETPATLTSGAASIPGYQLVCEIHRGGQGVVYQAIREKTGGDVAIKVLHDRRAASPRELERFEREAAVLRELNHPNLIAISEVGVIDGRPFLVMPYIPGWPLDEHVRRNGLSVRDTSALFLKVCDAVNVAHLNGVIHRDLKPSNIRVDDAGEPHVLDFGLAKTTAASPGESITETGQFVGSMPWASPEQAEPGLGRVDVRTDVYSLGAVLYQLLTGRLPIDPIGSQREVLNRIVTAEPLSPRLLRPEIDDEIETIVLKCLNKDRARRYSNADGLSADIRRYLAGEAIEAKRDSIVYVAKKLVRRHRGLVAAIGLVLLVGAVGGTTSFFLWQKAKHESKQAEQARDAESEQRARAAAVSAFLAEMLTAADPARTKGAKLTVREALDLAAKRIDDGSLGGQPLVEAEVRFTIGSTYISLALYEQAEAQLRAAGALQARELGEAHSDTLRTRSKLAGIHALKGDYAGTASLIEPIMQVQSRVLGPDHPDTLRSKSLLGFSLVMSDRFAQGEPLLRAAVDGFRKALGENHVETARHLDRLGEAYIHSGYPEKAEPLHRDAHRINTLELGETHPATLNSLHGVASALHNQNRIQEADPMYRQALQGSLLVLGPEHPSTLSLQKDLARVISRQGQHAEAVAIYRECLATELRIAGPDAAVSITTRRFLASCLMRQKEYEEAEGLLREALGAAVKKYGPEHGDTSIRLMCALSEALAGQQKDQEAEQVARQVLEFQYRQLPRPNLFELEQSSMALIDVLQRKQAHNDAMQVEQKLIEFWQTAARTAGASAATLHAAAQLLLNPRNEKLGDKVAALEFARRANELTEFKRPEFLDTLALAYHLTGDNVTAVDLQKKALSLLAVDAPGRADYEQNLQTYKAATEPADTHQK